jgi:hypothetical protein
MTSSNLPTNEVPSRVDIIDAQKPWIVNLQYLVLGFIMLGQAAMLVSVMWGQLAFLACNVLALWRCFALNRPTADKVKDMACLALTLGLLLLKFFG